MSRFTQMTEGIRGTENYTESGRVLQYVCNVIKNEKKNLSDGEVKEIKRFVLDEIKRLTTLIPDAETYRIKDGMFFYCDALMGLITLSCDAKSLAENDLEAVQKLVRIIDGERTLENAVDAMFELKTIAKDDIEAVLGVADGITDEYHKGMLYKGLHEYCDRIKRFTPEAKGALSEYVARDLCDMLRHRGVEPHKPHTAHFHLASLPPKPYEFDSPMPKNGDEIADENLEFAVDVCKHFITEELLDLLERAAAVCADNVKYYAIETLLNNGREVSGQVIEVMAQNLQYAELTYSLLKKFGKQSLFPPQFSSPEYLAKSDMVHWLTYPTELNGVPDEIVMLGKARVKKEVYYIFKYRSNSDTLSDDLKNEWLIGWSNDCGGTFSNFDKLSDYAKKTDEKTVKHIAKKLLK